MAPDYVRVCPTCGSENAPDVIRCSCGAMLFGLDLVRAHAPAESTSAGDTAAPAAAKSQNVICPYDDCGQENPPQSERCVYCNRALASGAELTPASETGGLVRLPAALADRYRIVRPFPAGGAEADLLLVEALAGGQPLVAKIYRQGIQPKRAVQERIDRIDPRYRVNMVETGVSGGHAFELMEHCARGSLRDRLSRGAIAGETLITLVRELSAAIAAVHAVGLVHRDLKPENVLIRAEQPLQLVLIDFGISSVLDATQRFTGVARTLPYSSPESLSGVIDGKADYWAMGMILLEATLGKHPFAGLSEAVILHHLTTRSIDVNLVRDGHLRMLLKGLLLRNPAARWGQDEIERWLANDAGLVEPVEYGPDAGFAEPYELGSDICATPEQLATALSRNWRAGVADLTNGQLLAWFRDAQKDQNVVRLLIELQYDRQMHVDVRLLKLLLHLAPGIPPVWRGESIELHEILARANLALKGDADAARWLHALYVHRVLEAYAQAGNTDAADVVKRWNAAIDGFADAWKTRLAFLKEKGPGRDPNEIPLFDDLVYGRDGPDRPPLLSLHPRLLALAYDAAWSERLRKRLTVELAPLVAQCPWLASVGDPLTMDATSLLVLESLLPEARKVADRQNQANARKRQAEIEEFRQMETEADTLIANLRAVADETLLTSDVCTALRRDLERFFNLLARVRSAGRADAAFMDFQRSLKRIEPRANHMMALVEGLAERRAANSGWLSGNMMIAAVIALWLSSVFLGTYAFYAVVAVIVTGLAWRMVPNYFTMQSIRKLAAEI